MPVTIFAGSPNKARIGGKSKNSPHLPTLPPLSRLPTPDSRLPTPCSLR
ncbi:hypothetical protein [Moorena bouillonii]|nr:hypothetical protein [Moorena bouillonii]NEO44977.1 hypothetical protein [Moorena sp. SIO4A3]